MFEGLSLKQIIFFFGRRDSDFNKYIKQMCYKENNVRLQKLIKFEL